MCNIDIVLRRMLYKGVIKAIRSENKVGLHEKMGRSKESRTLFDRLESEYRITAKNILGLGTSCIAFKMTTETGSEQVLKVCSKRIKFFKYQTANTTVDERTGTGNSKSKTKTITVPELQELSQKMSGSLLPIKEIVYDGKLFFAYIQDLCEPLKNSGLTVTKEHFIDLLSILQEMLSNGWMAGQLTPKNVGIYDGRLVLFDYHSMHKLPERIADKKLWWHSMVDSLTMYCGWVYKTNEKQKKQCLLDDNNILLAPEPDKTSKKQIKLKKGRGRAIANRAGTRAVPESLSKFFKYVKIVKSSQVDTDKMIDLLENAKIEICH